MTEEIIIDGINVVKCEFFNDCECKLYKQEYWERTDTTFDFCKEHPLCEYKATAILERLEQENKELKEYSKRMENQRENYYKEYNIFRSALEEIREIAEDIIVYENSDEKAEKILNTINEVLK